jgi:TIR domain
MTEHFHACFVSYRHPVAEGTREQKLIGHVVRAITDHVEMYTHEHDVYFDSRRLLPGYRYDARLAEAICRSACMVIVYWPSYLESDYCRAELEAMLEIEERRQQILSSELRGCRLFIPVILRGRFEELPDRITRDCHYLDYKAQATRPDINLGEDERTSEELYRIAEYIKFLCDVMKASRDPLFGRCHEYGLPPRPPANQRIQPAPSQPFPGR